MVSITAQLEKMIDFYTSKHQIISENIANANTPKYIAKDIQLPARGKSSKFSMMMTSKMHMQGSSASKKFKMRKDYTEDKKNNGNNVNLATESLKIAKNQIDHQKALQMYQQSNELYKLSLGK